MTQQSLAALQRMQEQTATLHKQFLDSREVASARCNRSSNNSKRFCSLG